jgi:RNA polymerase sigma-70 factor (ECF subfamily)
MSDPEKQTFLPTRQSLLSRLRDWEDQDSWREFFETYWQLIYDVARKAGLNDAEAQDVVQETVLSVAKQMPGFSYDSNRGKFKSWLRQVARCRIVEHLRRGYRQPQNRPGVEVLESPELMEEALETIADPAHDSLDALWDREWDSHLADMALQHVKRRVRPEHFQIFELLVIQGWPAARVAKALEVSVPLVYVTRHRIQAMMKRELKNLRSVGD